VKTTCPCRVPLGSAAAGIRTCDLLIASKAPVGATATTSHRRGRPVIDGGSRGAVGVATQVAGASYVDVGETDTYYA